RSLLPAAGVDGAGELALAVEGLHPLVEVAAELQEVEQALDVVPGEAHALDQLLRLPDRLLGEGALRRLLGGLCRLGLRYLARGFLLALARRHPSVPSVVPSGSRPWVTGPSSSLLVLDRGSRGH